MAASDLTTSGYPAITRRGLLVDLAGFTQALVICAKPPGIALASASAIASVLTMGVAAHVQAAGPDPNKVIDFRMDSVNVEGGKTEKVLVGAKWVPKVTVYEGQTVKFSCNWSANLVGAAYWKTKVDQTIQYIIKIDDGTIGFGPSSMPAGTTLGKKESKGGGFNIPSLDNPSPINVSGEATNYGNTYAATTGSVNWTAKGVGPHSVTCILPETGFQEVDLNNNIVEARLDVAAVPLVQSQSSGIDAKPRAASIADALPPVTAKQAPLPSPPAQSREPAVQPTASGTPGGQSRVVSTIESPDSSAAGSEEREDLPPESIKSQDSSNSVTTGQACALSVSYFKAESPVIETANSDLRQGDVFRVICRFTTDVKDLTWSNCDADTIRMVEGYRRKIASSPSARYSGMVDVNGSTVRVVASPPQGLGGFEIEHLWVQKEPGTVIFSCKVDNVLEPYVEGSGRYVETQSSVSVGPRIEGRKIVGRADLPPRGQAAVTAHPDKPDLQRDTGQAPPVAPGNESRPEMQTPLPPEQVDLHLDSDQSRLAEPDKLITPPASSPNPSGPSLGVGADYAGQQTQTRNKDSLTQMQAETPASADRGNSGEMNPIVEPVGIPVECALKGGGWTTAASVTVTNTTRQVLEKATMVKWTVYQQGIQLGELVNTETKAVYYGQDGLNAPLAVGQSVKVGIFAPQELSMFGGYQCKASVMPVSAGGSAR